ncbi:acyl-CoA dehydrogenase family protein [Microbacterium aurum]
MELSDNPEQAAFRTSLRKWLETTLPTLPPAPHSTAWEERLPSWRAWQRALVEGGYAGISWPTEFGGAGAGPDIKAMFTEECDRAGAPERLNIVGEDFAGPTIIEHGTPQQRSDHLRATLEGEQIWCQLFSEPDAGSDLASLKTRAVKVDGGWRVQGQKIWTSRAQIATHAILLARTGDEPRHKGITYFLLPMDTEGVIVRPLRHMLGEAEFNEVFLDDVFVPDDAVVGQVNDGWRVAMATLAHERVAIATGRVNTREAVGDLIDQVRETGRGDDPLVRQRIADLWSRALAHYLIGQRVVSLAAADAAPGPVTSVGKLYFCPLVEDIADFGLSLGALGGQLAAAESSPDVARWQRLAYQARGTAIAGGSTFIQRNIVAERILAMPRG